MAQPSRVAIALTSLFGGASAGVAIGTIAAWLANWMNLNGKTTFGDPRNVYVAGVVFGILVAAFLSWNMSSGLDETWRRAAISFTACAGALGGGLGAYGLSLFSIMMFNPLAQYFVPAYFILFVVIFIVSWRASHRQRQLMAGTPVSPAA
jgi:hypothetical protein